MPSIVLRYMPQPAIGSALGVLALIAVGGAWLISGLAGIAPGTLLLAVFLAGWVMASYWFPIHLERSQKAEMMTVSLYLMSVLLPSAPLASVTAGLGILGGEMLVRAKRGNYYSDVATATCRWMIVMLAGASFHRAFEGTSGLALLGTAAVLWVGDILTSPLLVAPMTGERPLRFLFANIRTSGLVEGIQYLLGLLGALAAQTEIWAVGLLVPPTILVYMALKNVKEVRSNTRLILESMADTVDLRDPYTGGHSQRVAELTAKILSAISMVGPEVELIVSAARVHDIGKIGVPDYVLNKPGRLTLEEEAIMQTHPDLGADLLKRYPDYARGVEIIRHHHESWDGMGYPQGLKATLIPFGSRVIAVADSYDAMTSDRPYRKAMSPSKAAMILHQGRGKQWDAELVDAFLRIMSLMPEEPARQDTVSSPAHLTPGQAPKVGLAQATTV